MTRKLSILILASLVAGITSGCASNPYKEFFVDTTGGRDVKKDSKFIVSDNDPRLFSGQDPYTDRERMLENGYALLGYSSFNSGSVSNIEAKKYGKSIHAATILLYSRYTNTVSGMMPLTLPNVENSRVTLDDGTSGQVTTYGTQTTYIPYSVNRFDYFASYWIQTRPSILGLYFEELTPEMRRTISSNKGVRVIAVRKGTPAFESDFLKGDIIKRIGNDDVYDIQQCVALIHEHAGQLTEIAYLRDGNAATKKVQFNAVIGEQVVEVSPPPPKVTDSQATGNNRANADDELPKPTEVE